MIVTFVSECRKKSIPITCGILDAYAHRIGRRTWQANVTTEGLDAIRERLSRAARRSTAVACHRNRNRRQTELLWVVGNRRAFDDQGRVAVHRTRRRDLEKYRDRGWNDLPHLKSLVRMAALWHDFGKAADPFQAMLRSPKKSDAVRHEWLSLLLLLAFVDGRDDADWLADLSRVADWGGDVDAESRWIGRASKMLDSNVYPLKRIKSPLLQSVAWLIVSHHRLPSPQTIDADQDRGDAVSRWLNDSERCDWKGIFGNIGVGDDYVKRHPDLKRSPIAEALRFGLGLPSRIEAWQIEAAAAAAAMLELCPSWPKDLQRRHRILGRLALVRGDHVYSPLHRDPTFQSKWKVYANTRPGEKSTTGSTGGSSNRSARPSKRRLNQTLDEHLLGVAAASISMVDHFRYLQSRLPPLDVPRELRRREPAQFGWQNRVFDAIRKRKETLPDHGRGVGTLVINMASTGTGKTHANAKIMAALSPDRLRVSFTLGLRTLTLQTGDEYRHRLGLRREDLRTIIGSRSAMLLHSRSEDDPTTAGDGPAGIIGSEVDDVTDEEFFFAGREGTAISDPIIDGLLPGGSYAQRRRMVTTPIVVCTIDHLMPAIESTRGGRHIAPLMRLLSSDLVIDEIDDFDVTDLPAILRLIHTAAMMGRNVAISSATIPPDLASGAFRCYHAGWQSHAAATGAESRVDVAMVDEFDCKIDACHDAKSFAGLAEPFVTKRAARLRSPRNVPVLQIGEIVSPASTEGVPAENENDREGEWFGAIRDAILMNHRNHHIIDPVSGRRVSVGLVRVANISPCLELTRFLLDAETPAGTSMFALPYHSQQLRLLRANLESQLDGVLNRKHDDRLDRPRCPTDHPAIRSRLNECDDAIKDVIFVVVATPVAEVGRDHDYDWAVVEPSSIRSLIQVSGRVRRHRRRERIQPVPNVLILDQNHRAYVRRQSVAMKWPGEENVGFVTSDKIQLSSHRMTDLIDVDLIRERIDASIRITRPDSLDPQTFLADLAHHAVHCVCTGDRTAAFTVGGWCHGAYDATDIAQQVSRFRKTRPMRSVYRGRWNDRWCFLNLPEPGRSAAPAIGVTDGELDDASRARLWVPPVDYAAAIETEAERFGIDEAKACRLFGTMEIDEDLTRRFEWIPELGAVRES